MVKLTINPLEIGRLGPLDGPFVISVDGSGAEGGASRDAETLGVVVDFVRAVAAGVSVYNGKALEESSNLNSFAGEVFEELLAEAPEAAARLENLTLDCSRLPEAVKNHPIWRLDRAILRTLPGAKFID